LVEECRKSHRSRIRYANQEVGHEFREVRHYWSNVREREIDEDVASVSKHYVAEVEVTVNPSTSIQDRFR
jgi:hypothetical protein